MNRSQYMPKPLTFDSLNRALRPLENFLRPCDTSSTRWVMTLPAFRLVCTALALWEPTPFGIQTQNQTASRSTGRRDGTHCRSLPCHYSSCQGAPRIVLAEFICSALSNDSTAP